MGYKFVSIRMMNIWLETLINVKVPVSSWNDKSKGTNHFRYRYLQMSPNRSLDGEESFSAEGIADVLMCHICISGQVVLRKQKSLMWGKCWQKTVTNKTERVLYNLVSACVCVCGVTYEPFPFHVTVHVLMQKWRAHHANQYDSWEAEDTTISHIPPFHKHEPQS